MDTKRMLLMYRIMRLGSKISEEEYDEEVGIKGKIDGIMIIRRNGEKTKIYRVPESSIDKILDCVDTQDSELFDLLGALSKGE
jgi:hypothetical protein